VSNYHYYFLPLDAKGIKSRSEAARKMHFELLKHPQDNLNSVATTPPAPTNPKATRAHWPDKMAS